MKKALARFWYIVTGNCKLFSPGPNGVCQVCNIPPAGWRR